MEITLEKIELVKDRTGVSYAEAKAALEKAGGSVVDAIIMIEEEIDIVPKTKAGDQASQIVEKIKALVKKGNISKILVKKERQHGGESSGQCGNPGNRIRSVGHSGICHRGSGHEVHHRTG